MNTGKQTQDNSNETPIATISKLRDENPNNPLIGYLNINSLRNKIVDLREVMKTFSPDYFVVAETKLDSSFPKAQFLLDDYEIRNRKDRDSHGGGLIEYVKKGIVCKEIKQPELEEHEIISSEINIRNKKWIVFSIYRPPNSSLKHIFLKSLKSV